MKSIDQIGITFANMVIGGGIFQGVINVQFGAFTFETTEEGKVEAAPAVTCRLRMDESCARQLYETLGNTLAMLDKATLPAAANGSRHPEEALN
jgi:hypothetical protein